jgi:hypothetical protein
MVVLVWNKRVFTTLAFSSGNEFTTIGVVNKMKSLTVVFKNILAIFLAFGFSGNVLGQKPSILKGLDGKIAGLKLKRDGSNFFRKVFESRAKIPFKAKRKYFYTTEGIVYSYSEVCIVNIVPGEERKFFQKLLSEPKSTNMNESFNGFPKTSKAFNLNVGFHHDYRDFRIIDPLLARANYIVVPMGKGVICDREVLYFKVIPCKRKSFSFLVSVDMATSLVVDSFTFDSNGLFRSGLICKSFEVGQFPLSPGQKWWKPRGEIKFHKLVASGMKVAGIALNSIPNPPKSFLINCIKTSNIKHNENSWLSFTYSDGIVSQFILFRKMRNHEVKFKKRIDPIVLKIIKRAAFYQINTEYLGLDVIFIGSEIKQNKLPSILMSFFEKNP